jgi:hypothetical protein
MAMDADRLTAAILKQWMEDPDAGFSSSLSQSALKKLLTPQIKAIAEQVIFEITNNADVDPPAIK